MTSRVEAIMKMQSGEYNIQILTSIKTSGVIADTFYVCLCLYYTF